MIVFQLSMPTAASWNGKWSGEGRIYARAWANRDVPKDVVGKQFHYRWDDGWVACITVTKMDSREARKLIAKSAGFYGYDWMIDSIVKHGKIIKRSEVYSDDELGVTNA